MFELAQGSGTITTLASFNGTNGANPYAGLIEDSSGNLFGTAYQGGASGYGTVFELAQGSGTITTLASFNGTNGANPYAGLIKDSSGNLYGTANRGGTNGYGTVFELAHGSGTITTLASFNGTNGLNPVAGLIEDSSGNLFGTPPQGGAYRLTARCSSWPTAAARSPRWLRSTAPTVPTPTPAWSRTAAAICSAPRTKAAPETTAKSSRCRSPRPTSVSSLPPRRLRLPSSPTSKSL